MLPSVIFQEELGDIDAYHEQQNLSLHNGPEKLWHPTESICRKMRRACKCHGAYIKKLTHDGRFLPTRDGKERADARVPPERAIRREGREMETTRGHREDDQRVDE